VSGLRDGLLPNTHQVTGAASHVGKHEQDRGLIIGRRGWSGGPSERRCPREQQQQHVVGLRLQGLRLQGNSSCRGGVRSLYVQLWWWKEIY